MVISSPCLIDNKELTSPEQTAPGKDFSNPLIVDSLLKTIWSSMHHVFTMKHWLVQSKRLLHNMVAFLEKSTGSAGFHQIIDFLNRSHICYALTKKPAVYISFIKQFWRSAEATTDDNGEVQITATIDGHSMTITEGSLRRHLKLDDQDGISSIPNSEIFEQLTLIGYHTDSDELTFQKGAFSPQWRFLIHSILYCLSPKKTAWEQFSSNIATAVICLATNRKITSSPSPSPDPSPSHSLEPSTQHSPDNTTAVASQPSLTQPSPTHPSPRAEHHFPTPHDSPLHAVHSHGSDEGGLKLNELMNLVTKLSDWIGVLEADLKKTNKSYSSAYTKLILRVKKLESQIKIGKERRKPRVVLSDDEVIEDDSSKQGRKLSDAEIQEKASTEIELFIQEVTPIEVIQDQGSSKKGSAEVSTARAIKDTASEEVLIVSTTEVNISTAGETVTYSRRSEEQRKRKDKGKAIMIESKPKKKSKKELKQERLSFAEAIKLEEQMNEEQRAQIARDEEIARQWDEEEKQRAMDEARSTKKIDWTDPSVIRPIFEKVWDFNQHIEPMEHGTEKMKSSKKMKLPEKIVEEEVDTQEEMKEVVKEPGAKRKKSIPRKSTRKRQKIEEDAEKEELKGFLDIILKEEVPIEVESLSTKFPIVDWKTCDVEELYRLVKEKYSPSRLEGFDLMLKGDLYTLFESDEEGEIWKNQHEYNLISWRLCDICGIHILLMENNLAIHMLTEKKYPLSQEMLSKMLSRKLEVDHESSQVFELLRFIRSQVQK
ncbi:hypothetical protein Tco_0090376 [Tanacetum coccineum]